ncbi:MAG: AAA family ATPase [Spirosomaceae bacterium]|jgi:predicted ATP-binding protein involved in virulence|nr:AAA family ATPase [Spirosomataceae bacterium]
MNPKVYFRSLSLENVRCFGKKQEIFFTDNGKADGKVAMWNVILGENGTGKTTVLRSLGYSNLFFLQKYYRLPFDQQYFPRIKEKLYLRAIGVTFDVNNEIYSTFPFEAIAIGYTMDARKNEDSPQYKNIEYYYQEFDRNINLLNLSAYGASRKISTGGMTEKQNLTFHSLFDEDTSLSNVEEWLVQTDYLALKNQDNKKYQTVTNAIRKLLREEISDFYIKTDSNAPQVFFKTHYGDVRLHDLSLGYKTLLAWITDFAKNMVEKYPESTDPLAEPAVCLVDEIDLHMHPKMQRSVVKFLRETFPQTQFIVTAHSPLIVQSEEDTNIILLRRNGDEVEVLNEVDNIQNWRIDQILESDLFGNQSGYSNTINQKIEERRKILLKDKVTKEDERRLEEIDNSLEKISITESPEYQKTLKILAELQK